MPTSKEYARDILDRLAELGEVRLRPMMGEYLLYYKDKLAGGLYDDRLLVKPVKAALALVKEQALAAPYPGAKPMLLVKNAEDKEFLCALLRQMEPQLPPPKPKKAKP